MAWSWVGSDDPKVIAGGHSHRIALAQAIREGLTDGPVAALGGHGQPDASYWKEMGRRPRDIPAAVAWRGQEVPSNFLLESDVPFRIAGVPNPDRLPLVPTEAIRDMMMAQFRDLGADLRHLGKRTVVVIDSPPPRTAEAVRRTLLDLPLYAQLLQKRKQSLDAVTPLEFRLALDRIRRSALTESAAALGVEVMPVPVDAVDADGALKDEYAQNATHANSRYGALVWQQLLARFGES